MTLKEYLNTYYFNSGYKSIIITNKVDIGNIHLAFGNIMINPKDWDDLEDHELPKKKRHIKIIRESYSNHA